MVSTSNIRFGELLPNLSNVIDSENEDGGILSTDINDSLVIRASAAAIRRSEELYKRLIQLEPSRACVWRTLIQ